MCAGLRITEEPVLAPDHKGPDGVLTRIVVDRQIAVFYAVRSGSIGASTCADRQVPRPVWIAA